MTIFQAQKLLKQFQIQQKYYISIILQHSFTNKKYLQTNNKKKCNLPLTTMSGHPLLRGVITHHSWDKYFLRVKSLNKN